LTDPENEHPTRLKTQNVFKRGLKEGPFLTERKEKTKNKNETKKTVHVLSQLTKLTR
jgi:hypothetical protein